MSSPHYNLPYTPCDYYAGRVDQPPCLNEGLYFCTICGVRYCDSHLCMHLAAQFEHENAGVAYESTDKVLSVHYEETDHFSSADNDVISNDAAGSAVRLFRESTEAQLRATPEMVLRSHLARMMSEAKRVQRELERRMIFDAEVNGIKRHAPVLSYDQREVLNSRSRDAAKTVKQTEKEEKKKAKVQAALEVLNAAIQSGKLTKEQVLKLSKKG